MIGSILGVKESNNSSADVSQEFMELLFSVESISLVEGRIIVSHMLENLLVEVVAEGWDGNDDTSNDCERFKDLGHNYVII